MSYKSIHISDELINVLYQISGKSEIARLLLRSYQPSEELVDEFPNFIGIASSDHSKISYLSADRIKGIIDDRDLWHTSKRTFAKPGTFIKKLYKNISEKDIETFSTLYKNIQSKPEFTMNIVSGEDIRKYYYYETYADQSSSLGASCMKHRGCQDFMDIYTNNSNVKMLVMLNRQDMLVGRAILWENVIKHDDYSSILTGPFKIMDRIYTINDETYTFHFRKWADDNGFIYKKEQKWNNTVFFESNDKEIFMKMSIKMDNCDFRRFPYMDTFKFISFDNSTIYNFKPNGIRIKTISVANGQYENSDFLEMDGYTSLFGYRSDMVYVSYKNYWTLGNNVRHSNINDCYILRDDAIRHDDLSDWIFINNSLNDLDKIKREVEMLNKARIEHEKRIERQREEMRQRDVRILAERQEHEERMRSMLENRIQAVAESESESHTTQQSEHYWDFSDYNDPLSDYSDYYRS